VQAEKIEKLTETTLQDNEVVAAEANAKSVKKVAKPKPTKKLPAKKT
jgi:hypothetical protein